MAGAVVFGLLAKPLLLTNIISVVCVALALVLVTAARRSVKALRFDVHEALNNIGNDELELGEYEDAPPETIRLKKMDNTNGHRSSRVSE
jgi:hypothetical protein